jgi:tRNA A37 threonylcarbamoyladenosine biosynthesis protein TsaE
VVIAEWADRILPLLPDRYLAVEILVLSPRKREIRLCARGDMYCRLLQRLGYL